MITTDIDGTTFDYHFYIKHVGYTTMNQINDDIQDLEDELRETKQRIFGLVVATPVVQPNCTLADMISEVKATLDAEFEYFEDTTIKWYKLILLREEMQNE